MRIKGTVFRTLKTEEGQRITFPVALLRVLWILKCNLNSVPLGVKYQRGKEYWSKIMCCHLEEIKAMNRILIYFDKHRYQ